MIRLNQDFQRRGGFNNMWWLIQISKMALLFHCSSGTSTSAQHYPPRVTADDISFKDGSSSSNVATRECNMNDPNAVCRGGSTDVSLDSTSEVTTAAVEVANDKEVAGEMSSTNVSTEHITSSATTTTSTAIGNEGGSLTKNNEGEKLISEEAAESCNLSSTTKKTNETGASDEINSIKPKSRVFGVYQEGDGHLEDPDGIPTRYFVMAKENRDHALKAFLATKEWRQQEDVDHILDRPHPKFDQVKYVFPHFFPGRDKLDNPILVQRPGFLKKDAMHSLNVTYDDLMHHMIYTLEYCWNIIEPKGQGILAKEKEEASKMDETEGGGNPQEGAAAEKISNLKNYGVMTSIIDLDGLGFRTLRDSETLSFVKRVVSAMSHHYPSRSYKTLLINTPRWFETIYALLKPLLRESTKQKIDILAKGKQQDEALRSYLGPDGVPAELLSTHKLEKESKINTDLHIDVSDDTRPGPNSQLERDMRAFCLEVLNEHEVSMLPIVLTETDR